MPIESVPGQRYSVQCRFGDGPLAGTVVLSHVLHDRLEAVGGREYHLIAHHAHGLTRYAYYELAPRPLPRSITMANLYCTFGQIPFKASGAIIASS